MRCRLSRAPAPTFRLGSEPLRTGLHSTGKVDDHGPVLQVDRVVIRLYLCGAVFGTFQVAGEQTKAGLPDRVVELFLTFIQGSGRVGHEILPVTNRRIICICSSKDYCSGGSGGFGTRPVKTWSSVFALPSPTWKQDSFNCPQNENCLSTCKRPTERESL